MDKHSFMCIVQLAYSAWSKIFKKDFMIICLFYSITLCLPFIFKYKYSPQGNLYAKQLNRSLNTFKNYCYYLFAEQSNSKGKWGKWGKDVGGKYTDWKKVLI